MINLLELPTVLIQPPQSQGGTMSITNMKLKINPDLIGTVAKANLPSKLAGPDGNPATTMGCQVVLSGIGPVLVTLSEDEFLKKVEEFYSALESA